MPGLGGDDEGVRVRVAREVEHAAGGQHVRALGVDVAGGHVLHHLRGAAALGVDHELGVGVRRAHGRDVGRPDARVHVALAVPDVHPLPDRRARRTRPSHMSGPNRISVSSPCSRQMCSTTCTAFDDVQQ